MAVYDLEEQEKIDSLKSWWRSYGTLLTIILAAFVDRNCGRSGVELLPEAEDRTGGGTV